jgi:RNA polymerase sigma-70 factor (ECF subfamily)
LPVAIQRPSTRPLPQDFERMFVEHHDLVYRVAYRVTGNAEDAEDVLQTLFLRLLRRECPLDSEKGPKAYLVRAAVNIALDVVKLRKRNVSDDAPALNLEDTAPTPDRQRSASEIHSRLRAALAELSPKVAEIFVLRHIEGYGNAEIAKMVGTSRGTVAVMLFRARAHLKKSMSVYFGEAL